VCFVLGIYDAIVHKAPSPWLTLGATQLILSKLYER
jgi:hypothetical protein